MKQPAGFTLDRTIDGEQITSWIKDDEMDKPQVYGVFNGGGPKGAAFSGAIEVSEQQAQFKGVAGTSAGAITAALLAAGYDGQTIGRIFKEVVFSDLLDRFDLEDVKKAAYGWSVQPDRDWLTEQILDVDPDLLTPSHELAMERALNKKLGRETEQPASMSLLPFVNFASFLTSKIPVVGGVFKKGFSAIRTGVTWAEAGAGASPQMRLNAIMDIIGSFVGSNLPPAIQQKMTIKGEVGPDAKLDDDYALSILLAMYYKGGAFKGQAALDTVEEYLQKALRTEATFDLEKPVTFRELGDTVPLKIMATDLSRSRLLSFPEGLVDYGYDGKEGRKHYLDFSISLAVRASMSIPLLFAPVYLPVEGTKDETVTLVDGGVINNFPIAQFSHEQGETPIYGFWLGPDPDLVPDYKTDRVSGYIQGLLGSMMEAHDKYAKDNAPKEVLLIPINLDIQATELEITALEAHKKEQHEYLDKQLSTISEEMKSLLEDRKAVEGEQELVAFLDNKVGYYEQAIADLNKAKEALDETDITRREAQTLDFSLTDDQKLDLARNGREAAEKAFGL
ncbi:MAG: patatin-like phospholipase family protein [Algicola sp.]|nr:patatin-like phospholipase family protein [Algicola sp.]